MEKEVVCLKCSKDVEISEIHTTVKELKRFLLGNGQPGIYQEFQQLKGGIKTWRFIISIIGVSNLIALITIFV